jgi:hypothetical protein
VWAGFCTQKTAKNAKKRGERGFQRTKITD